LANGINFAWQNGAAIINNSWGSNSIEQQGLINDAINNAVTQGRGGLGTIVICITHNQSASSIAFPANNPQSIHPVKYIFSDDGEGSSFEKKINAMESNDLTLQQLMFSLIEVWKKSG